MPTVSSVHVPTAMGNISIRGRGKKKDISMFEIEQYAKSKGVSFISAYREIMSTEYACRNEENK